MLLARAEKELSIFINSGICWKGKKGRRELRVNERNISWVSVEEWGRERERHADCFKSAASQALKFMPMGCFLGGLQGGAAARESCRLQTARLALELGFSCWNTFTTQPSWLADWLPGPALPDFTTPTDFSDACWSTQFAMSSTVYLILIMPFFLFVFFKSVSLLLEATTQLLWAHRRFHEQPLFFFESDK